MDILKKFLYEIFYHLFWRLIIEILFILETFWIKCYSLTYINLFFIILIKLILIILIKLILIKLIKLILIKIKYITF